jgi:ribosomal-protein-alanine N-acetyltransferase
MALPIITPLTPADLDAIMALERVCFKDPWTRRMYLADLTENELATYLAARLPRPQAAAQILAYGGLWMMADEAHIATIATHPDWRGCGLGLYLMLALLDAAQAQGARVSTLEVRADNLPAQRLYQKLGYEVVGQRRHYYRDGADGVLMTTPALAEPAMQERLAIVRKDALRKLESCAPRLS